LLQFEQMTGGVFFLLLMVVALLGDERFESPNETQDQLRLSRASADRSEQVLVMKSVARTAGRR
jgi:hypothetical protein